MSGDLRGMMEYPGDPQNAPPGDGLGERPRRLFDFEEYCDDEIPLAQHRVHRIIGQKVRYAKRDIARMCK